MSLRKAYHDTLRARPIIEPNEGFFAQLIEYEADVLGVDVPSITLDEISFDSS